MSDTRNSDPSGSAAPPSAPSEATDTAPARNGQKRLAFRLSMAGLAIAVAAGLVWYFAESGGEQKAQAAPVVPPPVVTVSKPLHQELTEWTEFTGQFAAVDYVEVRARVSGYLQSIHFTDGQMVEKGDLLFVIDPRPFEVAKAQAEAQLAEAEARLELANRQLDRASRLRRDDYTSQSTVDERLQDRNVAAAAVAAAQAAIKAADLNLEFTRITAPISGRISSHRVSVGNLVSGGEGNGTTLLTTIVSLDPIYFLFDMSEADFLAFQRAAAEGRLQSTRDNDVTVYVRLFDERNWEHKREGRLNFVDNQVDRGAGTIRVRAVFPNPHLLITPGQFGRLRLPGSLPYRAVLVPDSAIVTDQSRKIVMTVGDDGTVKPRVIRPGPMELGLRIVREGLSPDDRIIIDGLVRARPGAKVTPQPGTITPDWNH
ncbi:MAG TPA: efflux RND transporter periplasmic adaptor subunit [Alphaproteobacteria bacterium]